MTMPRRCCKSPTTFPDSRLLQSGGPCETARPPAAAGGRAVSPGAKVSSAEEALVGDPLLVCLPGFVDARIVADFSDWHIPPAPEATHPLLRFDLAVNQRGHCL